MRTYLELYVHTWKEFELFQIEFKDQLVCHYILLQNFVSLFRLKKFQKGVRI